MSRRLRRILKTIAPLVLLVLLTAACSSDGFPESYTDQVDETTGLSNVEANWIEGCEVSVGASDLAEDANGVCACSFAKLKAEMPFDQFVELNNELRSDPESLVNLEGGAAAAKAQLVDTIKSCIAA